jgi:hypothetical protein
MKVIPKRIDDQMLIALDNLSFCELVCDFLQEQGNSSIPTEVVMHGLRRSVAIPGENCGFITTPIIHSAILDIRRLLPFLGLKYHHKEGLFSAMNAPDRKDDYWIGDIGISPITPEEIDAVSKTICDRPALGVLSEILIYSNKQLAHFSKVNLDENRILDNLRLASRVMIHAVMIFVYDSAGVSRPKLHLIADETSEIRPESMKSLW